MDSGDKLHIAKKLEEVGVDVIEAGFPASSAEDYEAVQLIAAQVRSTTISSLARCAREDVDIAYEAVKRASDKMITLFYAVSDIHLEKKYHVTREDALTRIQELIGYARKYFGKIKFGLEDATRADKEYLPRVIDVLLGEGIDTIGIGDTVGRATPFEMFELTKGVVIQVNGRAKVAIHCHNDLGMATANTLSAILAGIDEVETTVNGIGERAGNAAFEEIAVVLMVRNDIYGVASKIKTEELLSLSELVYSTIGRQPSFEKPVVGLNAFRHESGIHVNGIQKDPSTYEIIAPEKVGQTRQFVEGRHSSKRKKKSA